MPHKRTVAAVVVGLFLSVGGIAQQPPEPGPPPFPEEPDRPALPDVPERPQTPNRPREDSQQPAPPVFRTGINFVRVDVIATDKQGNPVTNLEAADFEVTEDGRPQKIESFKLVKLTGSPEPGAEPARPIRSAIDQESEAAREDVRIFVIFLDDYHVRRGASMVVREPLVNFIQNQLGPLDMVAVMYPLTPLDAVTLTRNHGAVISAIEQFDGRKYDYTPRNDFEEKYIYYPAAIVERIRNQVSLSAIKAISIRLGGLREGRKNLILVSEGYSNSLPPQLRDPIAAVPGVGNPNRNNPRAGENNPREESMRFFEEMDVQSDLREVYNWANRNNTSIYTLDPRGLAPFEFDINEGVGFQTDRTQLQSTQDTLRTLASETDGRAIVNRNDLETGLRQIVRDASAYYLLGYNSSDAPADGKFHEIKVRVKKPGVQTRARKGYWALTAEESTRALAPPKPGPPPAVTEALSSIVEPPKGRTVRTWLGTERGDKGMTRVTFVWEPVPAVPGITREEPTRVSLTALGRDGSPYFRGDIPRGEVGGTGTPPAAGAPATAGAATAAAAVTAPARVAFDAEPGRMQMKMAVHNAKGQILDSSNQEIVIPDFTAPAISISTPMVVRARNALELKRYLGDAQAPPTPSRDFRRTDRLLIRFGAYAPGTEVPATTARLLNRGGKPMADLPIQAPSPERQAYQVDLPLAGLAVGEYLIEVTASAAGSEAKEILAFKVGS